MENVTNYIKLDTRSLFSEEYAYIDCRENAADQLFIDEKIRVRFGSHYISTDKNYTIVFCKIKKKDREAFKRALGKMTNKMLLMGYRDYPEFCEELISSLTQERKVR